MNSGTSVHVFAHGSNMCTQRMQSRVPDSVPVAVGYVSGRSLAFHKRSEDGSAKADAVITGVSSDRVWGVVYELPHPQKAILDRHEFLGIGYDDREVDVTIANGAMRAWMYVARADAIDPSLTPYSWCHDFFVLGAREHRLPSGYVERLRSIRSIVDPDSERHARNRRLIIGKRQQASL